MSDSTSQALPKREQILFCFCAPAGSGKSTISRALVESDPSLLLSISTTTRAPRAGEEEGRHYFFVDEQQFRAKAAAGEFLEHAQFGSSFYGTERRNLERAATGSQDLVLDIDVQGVEQLKKALPSRVVTIFVFPPSFTVLKERLRQRGTESEERQQERLRLARQELAVLRSEGFSDYLLLNSELTQAIDDARAIVTAERLRYRRLEEANLEQIFSGA